MATATTVSPLRPGSFKYGGGPAEHGTRRIGNWWSDHAVDLMAAAFSPVFALENMMVTSVTRRPSTGTGTNDGSTVFATGASGEKYAFLHLDPIKLPRAGQRLAAGEQFAALGDKTAGGPHLHFATQNADPVDVVRGVRPGDGIPDVVGNIRGGGLDLTPGFDLPDLNPFDNLWGWISEYGVRAVQVLGGFTLLLVGLVLLGKQLGVPVPGPRATR